MTATRTAVRLNQYRVRIRVRGMYVLDAAVSDETLAHVEAIMCAQLRVAAARLQTEPQGAMFEPIQVEIGPEYR